MKQDLFRKANSLAEMPTTFGELSRCGSIIGTAYIAFSGKLDGLLLFLSISLITTFCYHSWSKNRRKGIPLFPIFIVQQGTIYALPYLIQDGDYQNYSQSTITISGLAVSGFLFVSLIGMHFGRNRIRRLPVSKFPLLFCENSAHRLRTLHLGLAFLIFGLTFSILSRTGWLYKLLPGDLFSFFPILRTMSEASTLLGATISGMFLGLKPKDAWTWLFSILVTANILFSIIIFD